MSLKDEALRYMGYRGQAISPELEARVDEALAVCKKHASPLAVRREFVLERTAFGIAAAGSALVLPGDGIARHLNCCESAVLAAVTLGFALDREIELAMRRDLAFGVMLDAAADAVVEDECERLENEINAEAAARGLYAKSRFSPGYGDLPLNIQPAFLAALDAGRRIGLTCGASLLMNPRKSVTFIAGLSSSSQESKKNCENCAKRDDCPYRKHTGGQST